MAEALVYGIGALVAAIVAGAVLRWRSWSSSGRDPTPRSTIEAVTGVVLVAFGIRMAVAPR